MLLNGVAAARRPHAARRGRADQLDLRRRQDALLRRARMVAAAAAPQPPAAAGDAARPDRRPGAGRRRPSTRRSMRRACSGASTARPLNADAEHHRVEHRRLGRHRRRRARQLLHHRGLRAGEARQLARLAAAARRRQHAQRLPQRALGQGGDPDPPRQGEGGDQLAEGRRRDERHHRRRHLPRVATRTRRTSTATRSTARR